jgi:hypothetical protein
MLSSPSDTSCYGNEPVFEDPDVEMLRQRGAVFGWCRHVRWKIETRLCVFGFRRVVGATTYCRKVEEWDYLLLYWPCREGESRRPQISGRLTKAFFSGTRTGNSGRHWDRKRR